MESMESLKKIKIYGLPIGVYAAFTVLILIAAYTNMLPTDYIGIIAFLMVTGGTIHFIGTKIPFFNEYMGAAIVMPLFIMGYLSTYGYIPEYIKEGVGGFMKGGFQNLYVAAILVGSILSLDRKTMLKSVARYIPTVIGSQIVAIIFLAVAGIVTGIGVFDAIFMIGAPTMSGGSGGAIATLPAVYTNIMGTDMTTQAGRFLGYCSIGNVMSILGAAVLSKVLDGNHKLNGHGKLLMDEKLDNNIEDIARPDSDKDYKKLGAGLLVALAFSIAGTMLGKIIPQIAGLAWTIIIAIAIKAAGLITEEICDYANFWFNFMLKNLLPALVAGIGVASMDMSLLAEYFTFGAFIVIIAGIAGAVIGAGLVGRIFKLYPLESAITAAFCSVDIGGSGDLAILSATNRMNLLPFSSISTRIGGALMVLEISLIMPFFV